MTWSFATLLIAAAPLMLAGCAQSDAPPERGTAAQQNGRVTVPRAPPPEPLARPSLRPAVQAETEPTAGLWIYRQDVRGWLALFGDRDRDASLAIRCERSPRRLFISRASAAGDSSRMTLRTSYGLKSYDAVPSGGLPAYLVVSVAPADPHLDLLASSRGFFSVEIAGLPALKVRAWPEASRVIEDCRS